MLNTLDNVSPKLGRTSSSHFWKTAKLIVRDVLEYHIQLDVFWRQYSVNMISSFSHCTPTF